MAHIFGLEQETRDCLTRTGFDRPGGGRMLGFWKAQEGVGGITDASCLLFRNILRVRCK